MKRTGKKYDERLFPGRGRVSEAGTAAALIDSKQLCTTNWPCKRHVITTLAASCRKWRLLCETDLFVRLSDATRSGLQFAFCRHTKVGCSCCLFAEAQHLSIVVCKENWIWFHRFGWFPTTNVWSEMKAFQEECKNGVCWKLHVHRAFSVKADAAESVMPSQHNTALDMHSITHTPWHCNPETDVCSHSRRRRNQAIHIVSILQYTDHKSSVCAALCLEYEAYLRFDCTERIYLKKIRLSTMMLFTWQYRKTVSSIPAEIRAILFQEQCITPLTLFLIGACPSNRLFPVSTAMITK